MIAQKTNREQSKNYISFLLKVSKVLINFSSVLFFKVEVIDNLILSWLIGTVGGLTYLTKKPFLNKYFTKFWHLKELLRTIGIMWEFEFEVLNDKVFKFFKTYSKLFLIFFLKFLTLGIFFTAAYIEPKFEGGKTVEYIKPLQ